MKALFCACNSWYNHSRVGSHHLARGLAEKGWQVAFISDPISPAHFLNPISDEFKSRLRSWSSGGEWVKSNIFTWVPGTLLAPHNKPVLRMEWVARYWDRLTFPSLIRHLANIGFGEVDFVYVDSSTQAYWWQAIPHRKSVFRLADDSSGFAKHTAAAHHAIINAAGRADAVVYTAHSLKPLAEQFGPGKNWYLPNGVDVRHFSFPVPRPVEYESDDRPVIVYVGAMEEWFQYDWVAYAAKRLPDCRFVLIGPSRQAKKLLALQMNIDILGPRSFQALPQYLQHASVGIIPFDCAGHGGLIRSINPLKLYEYMISGLPVVATRWETLERLSSPALLADTMEEFCESIQTALQQKAVLGQLGREYAARFDWSARVDALLELLGFEATP